MMRQRRQGFATLVALMYMLAIATFSGIFLSTVHIAMQEKHRTVSLAKTRALAESGIHFVLAQSKGTADVEPASHHPLGDGAFSVLVRRDETDWIVESTGYLFDGDDKRHPVTVTATISRGSSGWHVDRWESFNGFAGETR